MRQAVIVAPDRFEVRDAPRPGLQADDEMIVRTTVSGICSGDLMAWYLAKKVGTVLGHEVIGRAEQVGPALTHVRPGDRVFLHHHAPCLDCPACRRGDHVHCATWKRSQLDPGGMAEWVRVPGVNARHDSFAVNDLDDEQAVFIEPLGCCAKAMERAGRLVSLAGGRVAVVGCGIMGLLNIQAARASGASPPAGAKTTSPPPPPIVVAVEPHPARREAARAAGAVEVLAPEEAARDLATGCDVVVIGPGHPDVIRQALGYVRPGGVACLFTPTATGVLTALDLGELYFREVSLVPAYSCGPTDTLRAYEWLREGRVDPRPFVTHRFALDDIQAAFATAQAGGAALKVLVTFPEVD